MTESAVAWMKRFEITPTGFLRCQQCLATIEVGMYEYDALTHETTDVSDSSLYQYYMCALGHHAEHYLGEAA